MDPKKTISEIILNIIDVNAAFIIPLRQMKIMQTNYKFSSKLKSTNL